MNLLNRLLASIRSSGHTASQILPEESRKDNKADSGDLTLTREQAEQLKEGTIALFELLPV
jgi:hypothetical protein